MFENLRLVESKILSEYFSNTEQFIELGNEVFSENLRSGTLKRASSRFVKPWVLYHSWKKGFFQLNDDVATSIRRLMEGGRPSPELSSLIETLRNLDWCDDDKSADLNELVKRSQDRYLAIQNEYELREFLNRIVDLNLQTVVEIGTARGGVLYCLSQISSRNATLVSIDLPGAPNCGGQTGNERALFSTFGPVTQDFHFIPDNSQLPSTRERLVEILDGRKIDLLFIDGDHSYNGCKSDFEMYKSLVADSGIMVFHDICLFPDVWGERCGVGLVWQELHKKYGGEEIIDPTGVSKPELGAGEHWCWGIGLLSAEHVS
jgi:23S rRNA U2552 (ribose-2'-O)-methylase RlmE/FtsJ